MPFHRSIAPVILAVLAIGCLACGGAATAPIDPIPTPEPIASPATPPPAPEPVVKPQPAGPSPASLKAAAATKCKRKCNSNCKGAKNKSKCVGQCRRDCDK